MCEFNAKRIVHLTTEQDKDDYIESVRRARIEGTTLVERDRRLHTDFVFWGKWFNGKARVLSVDYDNNTLAVETYREYEGGRQYSSVDYSWNLAHYLQGFRDGSYSPMKLLDENDPSLGDSHPLYFGQV